MMNWEQLLSPIRLGMENYHDRTRDNRNQFQRDYDRLIFSAPFRRLQNKTQVFPLPGSIFVHNRLTHSLEVASVGRSLANNVAYAHRNDNLSDYMDEIGNMVSAACLAHDMGNPPFGHAGEKAIATYFSEGKGEVLQQHLTPNEWQDITKFDGNANAFRLLTHQFEGRRKGGYALTYSTLSAIVKYPYASVYADPGKQKFGFFQSDISHYQTIANTLGIPKSIANPHRYIRSPLVYLVEAADDICYQIMDLEDAHKLKLLTTHEAFELFLGFFDDERKAKIEQNMLLVTDINEQMAYLRSSVIGKLVDECTRVFLENEQDILKGTFSGSLIKRVSLHVAEAYNACSKKAVSTVYSADIVLDIELAGYRIIQTLLDVYIPAVLSPQKSYSRQLLRSIPPQYQVSAETTYKKIQAVLDYISGMTDVYALDLYRKITGISIKSV